MGRSCCDAYKVEAPSYRSVPRRAVPLGAWDYCKVPSVVMVAVGDVLKGEALYPTPKRGTCKCFVCGKEITGKRIQQTVITTASKWQWLMWIHGITVDPNKTPGGGGD